MTYPDAIAFLYRLGRFGIKLGLRNIEQLLAALGGPQRAYPAAHVAGSNGKGSTAAFLAAILGAAGAPAPPRGARPGAARPVAPPSAAGAGGRGPGAGEAKAVYPTFFEFT